MRSSLFAATALALVLAFAAPARAGEIGQIGSNTGISAETGNQDDASLQDLHRPADQAQPKKKKLKSGLGQNNTQSIIIIDGKPASAGNAGNAIIGEEGTREGIVVQGGLQPNAAKPKVIGEEGSQSGIVVQGGLGARGVIAPIDSKAVVAPIDSQAVIAPLDSPAGSDKIVGPQD